MKTAVLHAVSHDLRSPLTAIVAAASGLGNPSSSLPGPTATSSSRRSAPRPSGSTGSSATCSTSRGSRAASPRRIRSSGRPTISSRARSTQLGPGSERVVTELDARCAARAGRRGADRARAREPARQRAEVLAADAPVRVRIESRGDELSLHVARPGPGVARGRARARVRAVSTRRRRRARRRARARDRARLRRGRTARASGPRDGGGGHFVLALRRRASDAASSSSTTSRRSCARCRRACAARATTSTPRRPASEALTLAAVRPPDAVILDLVLPDMRGTDVCRELRAWSDGAGHRALGRRRREREGRRARRRRRRLRHEAVRRRRAARAAARGAAPRRAVDASPCSRSASCASTSSAREVTAAGERVQLTPHEYELLRAARAQRGQAADAQGDPARGLGRRRMRTSRTTCTSTSRSCGASSSPIRRGRATSSPSRASATGSSIP